MSVFPELDRAEPKQLFAWFTQRNGVPLEDEQLWLDEIAATIALSGPPGIRFLLASIPGAKENRLHAILIGLSLVADELSTRRRTEVCNVARSLLADRRPSIVAEAIDLLSQLRCVSARDEVLDLRSHASPFVVGSVLRFLARNCADEAVTILTDALSSKQSIIRQNAIDELDDLGCIGALPAIKRLQRDKDRDVRQAACAAVANLKKLQRPTNRPPRRRTAART
jgi:HEAT repeats